jgi:probable blue pigment (indigoidine) exporter
VALLLFTGWQLVAGGLVLTLLSLCLEGFPPALTPRNLLGFSYLGFVGTGLAYVLWFRGIERFGTSVSFLGLLSPLVATLLGYLVLEQGLSGTQFLGVITVLASVVAGQWESLKSSRRTKDQVSSDNDAASCPIIR